MTAITREGLARWLDDLARRTTLLAPRDVDGVLLYRPVTSSTEVVWDFIRPVMSIKEAFLPATERLLTIEKTGQTVRLADSLPEGEQVIFGVRPCDARGMKVLDALFLETEPVDPYYARRRQHTTLIGLACRELGPTCFCTSVGGAPDDASDVDVMFSEVDGGQYALQVMTEKGEALMAECGWPLGPAQGAAGHSHAAPTTGNPPSPIRNLQSPVPDPRSITWPAHFNDSYWERMGERCLSCRICAYVCPTCRCFAVRDEAISSGNGWDRYERIRCWDSCAGVAYRRIAGGHNPRSTKGQRLRNRFFCKFYYYPEQYGPAACTGCGRCIDACPVNIDITEVLAHLAVPQEAGR